MGTSFFDVTRIFKGEKTDKEKLPKVVWPLGAMMEA